ncbi:hypothetical protein [Nostoc edaphicum]|nr:hypothetical protein [Nostoc edaphicum]
MTPVVNKTALNTNDLCVFTIKVLSGGFRDSDFSVCTSVVLI